MFVTVGWLSDSEYFWRRSSVGPLFGILFGRRSFCRAIWIASHLMSASLDQRHAHGLLSSSNQNRSECGSVSYSLEGAVCDGGDSTSKFLGVAKSLPSLMSYHPRQNWFLDWNCSLPVMWFQWEEDLQSLFSIILLGEASSSASFSRRGKCASSQVGSAAE